MLIAVFIRQCRTNRKVQISSFVTQLRLAKQYNLPVVISSRENFVETLACLTKVRYKSKEYKNSIFNEFKRK